MADAIDKKESKSVTTISTAPDMSLWQKFKETMTPDINPERATQAIIDSESLGISPAEAYEYGDTLKGMKKIDSRLQHLSLSGEDRVKRRWDAGVSHAKQGLVEYDMMFTTDPASFQELEEVSDQLTFDIPPPIHKGIFEKAVGATAEMLPIMLQGTQEGAERGAILGMGAGAMAAATTGPGAVVTTPVAMSSMFAVGFTSGSLENIMKVEAGLAFKELRTLTDKKGEQIDPNIARAAAFGVGVINSLLEVAQIKTLIKTIPGGDKLLRGAVRDTVMDLLKNKTIKNIATKYLKKYGAFITKETGQELAQESTNIFATELSKKINNELRGTDFKPAEISEITTRLADTAEQAALSFGLLGLPGPVMGVAKETGVTKKLAEPLKGEAGAIFPEGEEGAEGEGISFEESLKRKAKELGMAEHIGEKEDINSIQRDTFGDMVKAGKIDEALKHAQEGVEKYDRQTINDAIVAEEVKQVSEAKKEDREAIRANFKALKDRFTEPTTAEKIQGIEDEEMIKVIRQGKPMTQVKFNPQKHSLKDFVAIQGGINVTKEEGGGLTGELDRIKEAGMGQFLVVGEGGLSVDDMRMAAIEQGFLDEFASPTEFIEKLEKDFGTTESLEKVWSAQKDIEEEIQKESDRIQLLEEGTKDKKEIAKLKSRVKRLKDNLAARKKVFEKRAKEKAAVKLEKDIAQVREKASKMIAKEKHKTITAIVKSEMKLEEELLKLKASLASKKLSETERANKRIAQVKTEKEIMRRRVKNLKSIRDVLGLTENQMKKVNRKDPRLMSNYEFKQYTDGLYDEAVALKEKADAKAVLMGLINEMEFKNYNNLITAYGLPSINEMSTAELNEFSDTLSQYEKGDVFLSPARLEAIERTELSGARTWREVREHLAKSAGITPEQMGPVEIEAIDMFKGDAALSEKDPFFKVAVSMMLGADLESQAKYYDLEKKTRKFASKSNRSRGLTVKQMLIPQDKQVQAFMEAEPDAKEALAADMTPEQIEYANFMQNVFRKVYEQMLKDQVINSSRFTDSNYYAHIRRGFIETISDEGIKGAFLNAFKGQAEDSMKFGIIDDTGQILAYEKFFSHIMYRSGNMVPTANVTDAFLSYMRAYYKKQALDKVVVLIDMYAQAVSPTLKTRKGLPYDPKIKEFINKWINNKKGRKINFNGVIPQGGKLDILIRGGRAFTTALHLGFNIPVQLAAPVGEQSVTFINIGPERHALALKRYNTQKAKAIFEKYNFFVGKSLWEEISLPDKTANKRLHDALFSVFSISFREANKIHLLSALTEEEFNSGEVTTERLAEIRTEIARYRHIYGMESIMGSTSLGKAGIQYKSWAIPVLGRTARNMLKVAKTIKDEKRAPTYEESAELYRGLLTTITLITIYSSIDEEEDESLLGQIKSKIIRESLTFSQGLSLKMWLATPVLMSFIERLGTNIDMFVKLEKYKRTGDLKGWEGLKRQFTPVIFKQLEKDKESKGYKKTKSSGTTRTGRTITERK